MAKHRGIQKKTFALTGMADDYPLLNHLLYNYIRSFQLRMMDYYEFFDIQIKNNFFFLSDEH